MRSGNSFESFHRLANEEVLREVFTMCLMMGARSSVAALMDSASMKSIPSDVEFPNLDISCVTSSRESSVKENLSNFPFWRHFPMTVFSHLRGLVFLPVNLPVNLSTLFFKNSICKFASSIGLLTNLPSTRKLCGAPPLFQLSRFFVVLKMFLVSFSASKTSYRFLKNSVFCLSKFFEHLFLLLL